MHTNWFSRPFLTSNSPPRRWVCWWLILVLCGTPTSFSKALPIWLPSPSTQSSSLPYSFLCVCVSIVQTPAGCGESARKSPYGVESASAGHFAPHVPFALSAHAAPPLHGSGAQCESQSALRSSDRQNAWNESRIDVYSELGAQRKRLVHRNGAGRRFLPRLCVRVCELFPAHFPNQQAQADFGSTADDSIDRKPRQVRSANQSEAAGLCRRIGVNGMCSTRTTISCWKSYRSMSESSK